MFNKNYILAICLGCLAGASAFTAPLRLALAPYTMQANLPVDKMCEKIAPLVVEAAKNKAEVILLPELIGLDLWNLSSKDVKGEIKRMANEHGAIEKCLITLARKHKIEIIGATALRNDANTKSLMNSAFVITKTGDVSYQDKLTPTKWEKDMGVAHGFALENFKRSWGIFGVLTCLDVESPQISTLLAQNSPEVIFVPSMTESIAALHRVKYTAKARSIEHHAFVAVVGTIGKVDKDWNNFGRVFVATPNDKSWNDSGFLIEGDLGSEKIIYADLDLEKLRESRKKSEVFPARFPPRKETQLINF